MIKSSIKVKKRKYMILKNSLIDDQYPNGGNPHDRIVTRAIVVNDENKIALCHVIRNDKFGNFDYLETPGGGKEENETLEEGVKREIDEELGLEVEVICKIGEVDDYYNLISRHNFNHYYLCKIVKKTKVHFESHGDTLIKEILWLDIDEAIDRFEKFQSGVPYLVKQRELPILLEAKNIIIK